MKTPLDYMLSETPSSSCWWMKENYSWSVFGDMIRVFDDACGCMHSMSKNEMINLMAEFLIEETEMCEKSANIKAHELFTESTDLGKCQFVLYTYERH